MFFFQEFSPRRVPEDVKGGLFASSKIFDGRNSCGRMYTLTPGVRHEITTGRQMLTAKQGTTRQAASQSLSPTKSISVHIKPRRGLDN